MYETSSWLCPRQLLVLSGFSFSNPSNGGVMVNLVVVWFCIFLVTNDVESAFVSLFTICIYSLVKILLKFFAWLKKIVCFFLVLSFECYLYILIRSLLLGMLICNYVSGCGLSFHLSIFLWPIVLTIDFIIISPQKA